MRSKSSTSSFHGGPSDFPPGRRFPNPQRDMKVMRARTIAEGISRLCEVTTALILVIVCVINLTQVIGRYLVGYSLPWGEEVMRYIMMWLMMLGGVSCLYRCGRVSDLVEILGLRPPSMGIWA